MGWSKLWRRRWRNLNPETRSDPDRKLKLLRLFNHALTACRRVIFVLLSLVAVAAVATWSMAPDVKTLRPEIESFLKEELKFKEVTLGDLSWYWAGDFGIKADASSFSSYDNAVTIKKSDVTVNISILDLLSGKVEPAGIHLSGGDIQIVIDQGGAPQAFPIPDFVALKEMNLEWRYREQSGRLEHFTLSYESDDRHLLMRTPAIRVEMDFNSRFEPDEIEAVYSDLSWLPEQWRKYFDGPVAGEVDLRRPQRDEWRLTVKASSSSSSPAMFSLNGASWPVESFNAVAVVKMEESGTGIARFESERFEYRSGKNLVKGNFLWRDGLLKLSASSPYLEMPLIWRGLRPLGDSSWHTWLSSMKRGVATDARAEVELPWIQWQAMPTDSDLEALRYQVNGHVDDAEISLGMHDDFITRVEADVELDQYGLKAIISSAKLPHDVGAAKGGLDIPWSTLVLNVSARGDVDAGRMHHWLHEEEAIELHWGHARAEASVSLQWMPTEEKPRQASISLKPQEPWSLEIKETPIRVDGGEVVWTFEDKVRFSKLVWATPLLNLKTDMKAAKDENGQWQVESMEAEASGELEQLTTYYLLPVKAAGGRISASLNYDEKWHGKISMKDASWENFLGTRKKIHDPLSIEFKGKNRSKGGQKIVLVDEISCDDELLRLRGSGEVSYDELRLSLKQIESQAFAGAIDVLAPFGPDPWELNVNASYLNRNALPEVLSRNPDMKKPWALRANLERFVWDDAEINGVSIKLASALNSVAVMKAESLRSGELSLNNMITIFSMPGGGVIDLRSMEAEMEGLHLKLSATLLPGEKGGTIWRGFAGLEGNFGHMMKRAELSKLFEDGAMHILFSGKGALFTDQPWWQGLEGRLRIRVDHGRLMKGGTLSKFLSAISLADLPALFFGSREDLTKPGLSYKRLQVEATMHGKDVQVHKVAMRSSAMDLAGKGVMDMDDANVDLTLVMRPLQNLDAILSKIPLIRDMFGGAAHSFLRKIYRMHGPIADAKVEQITPEEAGLAAPGVFESLFNLPERWFGKEKEVVIP